MSTESIESRKDRLAFTKDTLQQMLRDRANCELLTKLAWEVALATMTFGWKPLYILQALNRIHSPHCPQNSLGDQTSDNQS